MLARPHVARSRPHTTHLCDIVFFTSLSISAYVSAKPSGWKMGSQPKSGGPLAGTMQPSVRPTNVMGSAPGPACVCVCVCVHARMCVRMCAQRGSGGSSRASGASSGGVPAVSQPGDQQPSVGYQPSDRSAHLGCRQRCTARRRSCRRSPLQGKDRSRAHAQDKRAEHATSPGSLVHTSVTAAATTSSRLLP
jgi:hypothetical protein